MDENIQSRKKFNFKNQENVKFVDSLKQEKDSLRRLEITVLKAICYLSHRRQRLEAIEFTSSKL